MEKFDYAEICRRVRALAQTERKWTNFELSARSGVSYRTISSIMRGLAKPQDQIIRKIAIALEVTPEDLGAKGLEPLPASVREPRAKYGTDASDRSGPTVYEAVGILADATSIDEDEILRFVMKRLPADKQEDHER